MRVVAGTYKGHRLVAPRGRSTRPTPERVREAVFSLLGAVDGARVVDLYAGSGALGIEALSRGAAGATFVDADGAAVRAVRDNLDRLGIEGSRAVRSDAITFLRRAGQKGERWDLAFCDPPYRLAHRLAGDLTELVAGVLTEEGRAVCESSYRQPLKLDMPLVTERRYGDTLIVVHAPLPQPGESDER